MMFYSLRESSFMVFYSLRESSFMVFYSLRESSFMVPYKTARSLSRSRKSLRAWFSRDFTVPRGHCIVSAISS